MDLVLSLGGQFAETQACGMRTLIGAGRLNRSLIDTPGYRCWALPLTERRAPRVRTQKMCPLPFEAGGAHSYGQHILCVKVRWKFLNILFVSHLKHGNEALIYELCRNMFLGLANSQNLCTLLGGWDWVCVHVRALPALDSTSGVCVPKVRGLGCYPVGGALDHIRFACMKVLLHFEVSL